MVWKMRRETRKKNCSIFVTFRVVCDEGHPVSQHKLNDFGKGLQNSGSAVLFIY